MTVPNPDVVMDVLAAWIGIVAGVLTSLGITFAFLRWGLRVSRQWLDDEILAAVARMEEQLTPNGGNTRSLGDTVMRMEMTLRKMAGETPEPDLGRH